MKNSPFYKQAELMLRCLAPLSERTEFALKGGTALNFFIFDLPRLSVDIDLVYLPAKDYETGLKEIDAGLTALASTIQKLIPGSKTLKTTPKNSKYAHKLNVMCAGFEVTIEPNLVIRQTIKKPRVLSITKKAEEIFETSLDTLVLDPEELLAGKLCAALDRQHPRDFFDVYQMFKLKMESDELRKLFLAYLCGGNRPLHEVLFPTLLDIELIYKKQFAGMTHFEVPLQDLYGARDKLLSWVHHSLTAEEKEFLISFVEMSPDFLKLGISGAENFPSILWKQANLKKLKEQNPKKFILQSTELKKRFKRL
jgi:predicted nucleotidyltransferase component of viral defense system